MLELFRGRYGLTYRGERLAFVLTLLWALPVAAIIGSFIHEEIAISQIAFLLVVAMIYVTLARGRLLGSSVRVHEQQYPRLFGVVRECASMLQIPMPLIFVREDYQVPITSVGFGQPYSLVVSSHWIEHFEDDELRFLVGRELGHMASGHTRFTSLLSANGNENPIVSLIFGGWLRRTELTCDRVGLLCCGSLDAAMRAIVIAAFHHFGRNIDYGVFAEQAAELRNDSGLRLGEWLGAMPYATRRIEALRAFAASPLYAYHQPLFAERSAAAPPALLQARDANVTRRDCAGIGRRLAALVLDTIVVLALTQTIMAQSGNAGHITVKGGGIAHAGPFLVRQDDIGVQGPDGPVWIGHDAVHALSVMTGGTFTLTVTLPLYLALLVAFTGQSLGMMVAGLRVVRTNFGRPNGLLVLWRYVVLIFTWPFCFIWLPFFARVYPHDWLSGTRVVKNERLHIPANP